MTEEVIRIVSAAFGGLALVSGLIAAWLWFKSSVVKIRPKVNGSFGGGMASPEAPWVQGAMDAFEQSSALNRWAAVWTALSVACSGVATCLATVPL
jgi:hypothetical protein